MSVRVAIALLCLGGCTWVSDAKHQARLGLLDADGDGHFPLSAGGDDCDDADSAIHPGLPEVCATPYDDNCDGIVNDGDSFADGVELFEDRDGDGFGAVDRVRFGCPSGGWVSDNTDCDDTDPNSFPGAPEICPPHGPNLDCSDEPSPCSLGSDKLTLALKAQDAGVNFVANRDLVVESGRGRMWMWEPAVLVDGGSRADAAEIDFFDGDAEFPLVALGGKNIAVSMPAKGNFGGIQWVDATGSDWDSTEVKSDDKDVRDYGMSFAWFGDASDPQLATLERRKNSDLLVAFGPPQNVLPYEADTEKGATRLIADTANYGPHIVVIDEVNREFLLYKQTDGGPLESDGWVRQGNDGSLGTAAALSDLNQDGYPDLIVAGTDMIWAWKGPIAERSTTEDAWWSVPVDGVVDQIIVGQLTNDTAPDVVFTQASGAGLVGVLRGSPGAVAGADGLVWLTVRGALGDEQLGSSVGITRVGSGESARGVLLMGASGAGEIRALELPSNW